MIVGFNKAVQLANGYTANFWHYEPGNWTYKDGIPTDMDRSKPLAMHLFLYKDFETWLSGGMAIASPKFVNLEKDEQKNDIEPPKLAYIEMSVKEFWAQGTTDVIYAKIKESYPFFSDALNVEVPNPE